MIDIDTDDEELIAKIQACLPKSPWVRTGKKGMAIAYRWNNTKNFKLRGADGNMILEFLGLGNQLCVPPSIHPDTQRPYTATANLWEVLDRIPELPADIEIRMRELLGASGVALGAGGRSAPLDIVASGDRDNQMVRHAGYLSRVVLGIDRSASLSLAEAIMHMYTWVEQFTAKVSGDSLDPNKGVTKLLEFVAKDVEKGRILPNGWDGGLSTDWLNHPTIQWLAEQNADRRWSFSRVQAWLADRAVDDADSCGEAAYELITLIGRDDKFNELLWPRVLDEIKRVLSVKITKGDLKKLKAAGTEDEEFEDQEAIARSLWEDMQRTGEIRFDKGQFWQWSGSCWRILEEREVYLHTATNVKGSVLVRRHSDYNAVVAVLAQLCAGKLEDSGELGLNFANGWVGEDLVLVDHDPKFGATFTLPFEYHPEKSTQCFRWLEFLGSVWGLESDYADRLAALQEMMAATLFKRAPKHQRAFLLYGRAGTGKTQILKVLRSLVPPEAVTELPPEAWGERFSLTALVGKAVNICGELPESGMISGDKFKQIIEGAEMRSEYKGVDGFAFTPECAHWFASNYLPQPVTRPLVSPVGG